MKLEIGNEKRFSEFIGRLNEKDKIALITHTDLDGLACGIVVNKVIDADILKFVGYDRLNLDLVNELKEEGATKVIFTDLFIEDVEMVKELEKFAEVMILDHHLVREDVNSDKTVLIKVEPGYSAGYLCYELFRKIQNLDKLDWIVACCCISDYCHVKTSDWLKEVFAKYGDTFEIQGDYVRKSGKIWDLTHTISMAMVYFKEDLRKVYDSIGEEFGDINELSKYAKEVQDELDRLANEFHDKREEFPGGYFYLIDPKFSVTSLLSNSLSLQERDKTYVFVRKDGTHYNISCRRQDRKISMNDFLKDKLKGIDNSSGGGHVPAAGGSFPKEYLGEFKRNLGVKE